MTVPALPMSMRDLEREACTTEAELVDKIRAQRAFVVSSNDVTHLA